MHWKTLWWEEGWAKIKAEKTRQASSAHWLLDSSYKLKLCHNYMSLNHCHLCTAGRCSPVCFSPWASLSDIMGKLRSAVETQCLSALLSEEKYCGSQLPRTHPLGFCATLCAHNPTRNQWQLQHLPAPCDYTCRKASKELQSKPSYYDGCKSNTLLF